MMYQKIMWESIYPRLPRVQVLVVVAIVTLVRCRRHQRHTLEYTGAGAASTASLVLHTADPTV